MQERLEWDLPGPFTIDVTVSAADIDNYGHVNNSVYLSWLDQCAWAHSDAVGISQKDCDVLGRGMVVRRTQIEYLQPCFNGEELRVGNWIVMMDGRLRADRRYQIIRKTDAATVVRALTHFVCVDLKSGRPKRMPDAFVSTYSVLPAVQKVLDETNERFLPGVDPRG